MIGTGQDVPLGKNQFPIPVSVKWYGTGFCPGTEFFDFFPVKAGRDGTVLGNPEFPEIFAQP